MIVAVEKRYVQHIYICMCARACVRLFDRTRVCGCTGAGVFALVQPYLSSMLSAGAILSAASLAPPHFSTPHQRHDFRKTVTEHKTCVLIFSTTCIWNIFHSKNKSGRYCNKCRNVFIYSTSYFCYIVMKFKIFSIYFRKSLKYQISSKSVQWELSCSMRTD